MEIPCKKEDLFKHNYIGGICFSCKREQVQKKVKEDDYAKNLQKRIDNFDSKKVQSTYHQHLAMETAKLLDDMKSLGIYMRLFKRYDKYNLIRARDWVLKTNATNKGKVFVSVYKKFL